MDLDRENLLSERERDGSAIRTGNSYNGNHTFTFKSRKSLLLLILSLFIATSLAVYLYLNLVAIDSNQTDPDRYKPLSRRKPMLDHESIFADSGPTMWKLSDLLAHCVVALQVAGKEVVNLSLVNNNKLGHVGSKGQTLEGSDDVVTGSDLKSHQMILNTIKDSYRRLKIVSEEDTTRAFENTRPEDDILPIDRREFAHMLRNNLQEIEGPHIDRGSLIAQHETLVWIDPLDATKEYSENLTDYVTLMACIVHKSEPIAGIIHKPFTNQTFWSFKDDRRSRHYHSPDLVNLLRQRKHIGRNTNLTRIIVSRSHAGDVASVLDKIYGDRATIVTAGGSGYKTIELINNSVDAYIHMTHIKKWDICAPHAILNSVSGGIMTDLGGKQIGFGDPQDKVVVSGLLASMDLNLHSELSNSIRNSRRD